MNTKRESEFLYEWLFFLLTADEHGRTINRHSYMKLTASTFLIFIANLTYILILRLKH